MNKKTNQNPKVNELELFREHVVAKELEAREAEALYKKYHYTIEASKLRDEYSEVMRKEFELMQKAREEQAELLRVAKQNAEILNAEQNALPSEE